MGDSNTARPLSNYYIAQVQAVNDQHSLNKIFKYVSTITIFFFFWRGCRVGEGGGGLGKEKHYFILLLALKKSLSRQNQHSYRIMIIFLLYSLSSVIQKYKKILHFIHLISIRSRVWSIFLFSCLISSHPEIWI